MTRVGKISGRYQETIPEIPTLPCNNYEISLGMEFTKLLLKDKRTEKTFEVHGLQLQYPNRLHKKNESF